MPVLLAVVNDQNDPARVEQLQKIYADAQPERLALLSRSETPQAFVEKILQDDDSLFYCGLFNERLIAAAVIRKQDTYWEISHLCVRSVTRRRGVGSRLLSLILNAARTEGKEIRIPTEVLLTPDLIILQRMGYCPTEAGDHYQLSMR